MRTLEGKTLLHVLPVALLFVTEQYDLTVVVYPLLALIDNQMRELTKANILAATWTGHTTWHTKGLMHGDIGNQLLRCILTTPEQLDKSSFRKTMQHVLQSGYKRIQFVVDEAHCTLDWQMFRDSSIVRSVKDQFDCSLLLLSPTLTKQNALELSQMFGVQNPQLLVIAYLQRPNIEYKMNNKGQLSYPDAIDFHIVYCTTKAETDAIAETLERMVIPGPATWGGVQETKYKVAKYHTNIPMEERQANQLAWERGDLLIRVGTSAFALGINCANVRFVIHTKMPTLMGRPEEKG
ncbi:P-loop containing nucleoside triphosphate hydrolase protein [Phlyctochytrium arcticum]|nr:P-loop containing nucleoside triphosphate hydrolase protein [Phlyctochytrium arcticum]